MTDQGYFNNTGDHGNYQFIPISDIIDDLLLESQEDDSYLKNIKRYTIIHHAFKGVKRLNRNVVNNILAFEITVPESLTVVVPPDFVSWVRISVVVSERDSFVLKPLNENRKINTAIGYLQDNKSEILFDNNGEVLTADASNVYNFPFKRYSISEFSSCTNSYSNLKTSEVSRYGEFVFNSNDGLISFSSDLMDKEVVIEYLSDGLQANLKEEEVRVHKDLEEVLKDWIYYSCIERKRNVPSNEKQRALLRYKTTLHHLRLNELNLKAYEIIRRL